MAQPKIRILELYSGIGGMHYAAERSDIESEVVFSVDINTSANEVYRHNFPDTNQQSRNIESLKSREINKLKPDVIMMSPPCQPFTRVGLKLDVEDARCSSFLHLLQELPHLETVNYILMENVVGFEASAMRMEFVKTLKSCGFYRREFIVSPEAFDIPNSRNRYYLLARKASDFHFGNEDDIVTQFPSGNDSSMLLSKEKSLEPYLETHMTDEELDTFLLSEKTMLKYLRILDVRRKSDTSSCCFTKAYTHYAEGTGSVLQHNCLEDFHQKFTEFEISQDPSTLRSLQLRYFTPREVANLMGFPASFKFPPTTTNKTRYRLLGNSLNVFVVSKLFNLLWED
uniref:tRNA (cytosine(38)-C(5))-methyltransferase n=1 Tax=Scapholeberis mucronata TaxID=202097 RepID=A0A4Y7NLR5_9CRUS|nr:EOG090X0A4V [Scapholeberis mucronata]SVE93763.1 EOG090X0A4V [Scapholeberis mucronata]